MNRSRVVVTGLGVRAPGSSDSTSFWSMITAGRTATRKISRFDPTPFRSQIAAECDFDAVREGLDPSDAGRLDLSTQFALAASAEAWTVSGLDGTNTDPIRIGVTAGTAVGCTSALEREYVRLSAGGSKWAIDSDPGNISLYDHLVPSSMAVEVARGVGAEGPVCVVSTGCTSGIDAIGVARETILEGRADVMIAGAAEAPISPITVASFDAIRATSPRNDSPESASRPFDRTRDGFVLGEGAAFFVLEEYGHARRRGAQIYAEIAGYSTRCNAYHMTGLRADGAEMADAIEAALREARMALEDLDYVNAHGSGTRQNDRHETSAFKRSLGAYAYDVPISSIKSMVGHSLGAIGSIEIAASVLALMNNIVPPTANLLEWDPECDLDYVPLVAREQRTDRVLTVGSGFGGFQSAMILKVLGAQ